MKKINIKLLGLILPALLFLNIANAQKLPGLQKAGLRAPSAIKIDGKTTEWNNQFQAYNKAIQAFYTISNDDNRLYLTIQATKREVINKLINGGVSFIIQKGIRKTITGAMTVTYPVFNREDRPNINVNAAALIEPGSKDADKRIDSLMKNNNLSLTDKSKFIRVIGIGDLDTLVSIYNINGIKAATAFNNKMAYTVEFAIDLKLLGMSVDQPAKFNYNIRFNEIQIDYVPGVMITRKEDGTITMMNVVDSKLANSYINALSTTDCWGQYTLVK